MKRLLISASVVLSAMILLSGCVAAIGNRDGQRNPSCATLGQQLIDLKKAQDAGVINQAEYDNQRAKLLGGK